MSFATNGACSSHQGVNCSAGPDFDGSVICYDGWKQSSVAFSFADECKKITTTCDVSALNALLTNSGLAGSSEGEQRMADCIAKNNISTPPPTYTYTPVVSAPVETIAEKQAREDKICHEKYSDINSHAENGNCVCNIGYTLYSNTGVCELKKITPPVETVATPEAISVGQITPPETPKVISTPKTVKKPTPPTPEVEIEIPQEPTESVDAVSVPSIEGTKLETPQPLPKKSFWGKLIGFLFGF